MISRAACIEYIEGEYEGEIDTVTQILARFGFVGTVADEAAVDIAGYYTGCMCADGTPRSRYWRDHS